MKCFWRSQANRFLSNHKLGIWARLYTNGLFHLEDRQREKKKRNFLFSISLRQHRHAHTWCVHRLKLVRFTTIYLWSAIIQIDKMNDDAWYPIHDERILFECNGQYLRIMKWYRMYVYDADEIIHIRFRFYANRQFIKPKMLEVSQRFLESAQYFHLLRKIIRLVCVLWIKVYFQWISLWYFQRSDAPHATCDDAHLILAALRRTAFFGIVI